MIILRELKEKDAILMLEWMHDEEIQKGFQKNMLSITLEQAREFCRNSKIPAHLEDGISIHFAVADKETDEYLGTISMKDINFLNKTTEYAISMRKKAQGKGNAQKATGLLLQKAFLEYGLHKVYLNVLKTNERAIHLYEKCGFMHEGESRDHVYINGKYETLEWYSILNEEFDKKLFA